MFTCKCGRICKSKGGLTLHQKKCFSEAVEVKEETATTCFVCTRCNKVCKSKGGLTLHQKKCGSEEKDAEALTCDTCGKRYKTQRGLDNHVATCKRLSQAAVTVPQRTAPKKTASLSKKTSDLLKEAYDMYNEDVFDNRLPKVPIRLHHHMYLKAGVTHSYYNFIQGTKTVDMNSVHHKIIISIPCHQENPKALLNTLLHEMCHVASVHIDQVFSFKEDCHGATWQKWTRKAFEIHPEVGELEVTVDLPVLNWAYYYKCGCKGVSGWQTRKRQGAQCKQCFVPYSLVKK